MHAARYRWQDEFQCLSESPRIGSLKEHAATMGLLVTIGLQMMALLCRRWYVLYVDIDVCDTCGQLIVATGMAVEEAMEQVNSTFSTDTAAFGINQDTSYTDDVVVIGIDDDMATMGGTGDIVTLGGMNDFKVQHEISMQIGLWSVLLCTDNPTVCGDLELSMSMSQFGERHPFKSILESVHHSRPFLILSFMFSILTLLSTKVASNSSGQIFCAGAITVVLTLLSVVIAGLGYLVPGLPAYIRPGLPVSLIAATLSVYTCSILLYNLQMGRARTRLKCLQSWNLRYIHLL